jgi:hypothetical protein
MSPLMASSDWRDLRVSRLSHDASGPLCLTNGFISSESWSGADAGGAPPRSSEWAAVLSN